MFNGDSYDKNSERITLLLLFSHFMHYDIIQLLVFEETSIKIYWCLQGDYHLSHTNKS